MTTKKYIYNYNINDFVNILDDYISKKPLNCETVVICIGTEKIKGDCLGPFTGSILKYNGIENVFGTLEKPVHALNLEKTVKYIYSYYTNPFVLAVDASLGLYNHIGAVNIWEGSLAPGSGIDKKLINVGDISVTGIVNSFSNDGFYQLRNSKLSVVMDMADMIGNGISKVLNYY